MLKKLLISAFVISIHTTIMPAEERKTLTYREVFPPIVQAVLEGDYYKFNLILRSDPKPDLHVRMSFGYNLGHVAGHDLIFARLKRLGVFSDKKERITCFAAEDEDLRFPMIKLIVHPKYLDAHGKLPTDYTPEQRRKNARSLVALPYEDRRSYEGYK